MSATTTATTTSTFRIELFPALPPTNNTLDPEQRSRLLRSTRKLGAVLGTTPFLLEPDAEASASLAPRVHAARREARIFHSPSSSLDGSEPEYASPNSSARSAPSQYQSNSASSSRSPSPLPGSKKRKGGSLRAEGVLPPIAIVFDIPGSTKVGSGSKGREQPLFLRLHSVPTQKNIDSRMDSITTMESSESFSPTTSSFNMDSTSTALSDREKRKKIAKLTRTLGENIPPELVFRSSQPRRAASRSRVDSLQKPTNYASSAGVPPLAVAAAPQPSLPTESQQSKRKDSTRRLKHKHRPRSRTLGDPAAFAAANIPLARMTNSLDLQPTEVPKSRQGPFVDVQKAPTHLPLQSTGWGRRKERDWSGEWNIKDMEDVAKKLRDLKGR